jgi:UDPglucose 6-dehydrogenase
MKIGIFGLGYVGSAVAESHKHHTLVIRDPKLKNNSASLDEIKACDAVYICVPTPMGDMGECDESFVKSVLNDLRDYKKVIIAKSTIPPNTYNELQQEFLNLVHVPEFLTAANATNDYINASWVLLGGNSQWCQEAKNIISSSAILATNYHFTNIQTASMFKYLANSLMATKVIFMNELFQVSTAIGINWNEIKEVSKYDPRLGTSHWDVPGPDGCFGYGGACFPKDVSAIIKHAAGLGIELNLLKSVKEINNQYRKD